MDCGPPPISTFSFLFFLSTIERKACRTFITDTAAYVCHVKGSELECSYAQCVITTDKLDSAGGGAVTKGPPTSNSSRTLLTFPAAIFGSNFCAAHTLSHECDWCVAFPKEIASTEKDRLFQETGTISLRLS